MLGRQPRFALTAGCGLLDTDKPDIVEPGTWRARGRPGPARRRVADFAVVQDGDGTGFVDGRDPPHRPHGGRVRAHHDAAERAGGRSAPGVREQPQRRRHVPLTSPRPGRGRGGRRGPASAARRAGRGPRHPRDVRGGRASPISRSARVSVPGCRSASSRARRSPTAAPDHRADVDPPSPRSTRPWPTGHIARSHRYRPRDHRKARALLDRGLFTDSGAAAAAVAAVPTDFQYVTQHAESPHRPRNAIFRTARAGSGRCRTRRGTPDCPTAPRRTPASPFIDEESAGLDKTTPQFTLLKYPDASALGGGGGRHRGPPDRGRGRAPGDQLLGMRTILNDLRDFADIGLDPLPTAGHAGRGGDLLFSERAFWLFATGHRLGDMRRLIRQYDRTAEQAFPNRALRYREPPFFIAPTERPGGSSARASRSRRARRGSRAAPRRAARGRSARRRGRGRGACAPRRRGWRRRRPRSSAGPSSGLSEPTSSSAGVASSPSRASRASKACSACSSRGTVGAAARRACPGRRALHRLDLGVRVAADVAHELAHGRSRRPPRRSPRSGRSRPRRRARRPSAPRRAPAAAGRRGARRRRRRPAPP